MISDANGALEFLLGVVHDALETGKIEFTADGTRQLNEAREVFRAMCVPTPPQGDACMTVLLPCPFCGGSCDAPQNYGDSRDGMHRFVACRKCGANIYRFKPEPDEADAALVEAWNARTPAPQTHSTDDEAGTLVEKALDNLIGDGETPSILTGRGRRKIAHALAPLLSRIPSEEATEEDAFKTCDAIEAVMSKWQSVPSNGGYVVSQFSQAGLRITRTPGGQT